MKSKILQLQSLVSQLVFSRRLILYFSCLLLFVSGSITAQINYIPFVRTGALGTLTPNQCVDDIVTSWTPISGTWTPDTANPGTLTTGPGSTAGQQVCYTGGTNQWHTTFNNATPLSSATSGCITFNIPNDDYDGHFVVGLWEPNGTTWGTGACQIYVEGNTLINSWRVTSVSTQPGATNIAIGWQTANWGSNMTFDVCFDATTQEFYANFDANADGTREEVARGGACFVPCDIPFTLIKRVGAPTICDVIDGDPNHPLASLDCDGGTVDNYTECQDGKDPTDPADDVIPCNLNFDLTYTYNDAGNCRFYVTMNCDDTACPVSTWDYEITAGTVSITGSGANGTTLNAATMNSFRPSVMGCGNVIRITREDFATAFPAGFGEDITFTLTANSADCGCTETSTVVIPRMHALTFDNQGPQRDATATTSWVDPVTGDYNNGSATATSSWPMPPPLPNWGMGGPTFIDAAYLSTGDAVCGPVGWAQFIGTAGLSICEITLGDGTVIMLPAACAIPAVGPNLATDIANALNACPDFLNHPSIQGNGLCSSVGTIYPGNMVSGQHACVNWNFMYTTGYTVSTFKICEDATSNVIGEFIFGDASVDFGY